MRRGRGGEMCFDKGCRGGKVGRRQGGGGRRVQKQEPEPISDFKPSAFRLLFTPHLLYRWVTNVLKDENYMCVFVASRWEGFYLFEARFLLLPLNVWFDFFSLDSTSPWEHAKATQEDHRWWRDSTRDLFVSCEVIALTLTQLSCSNS